MKKNKVLVIGSKGMLGLELTALFSKNKKNDVISWDVEDIDITKETEAKKRILELKPGLILNAAAYNAVDRCEESEGENEKAKKINGAAPGFLAKIAKEIGATFVHYSTDYVFNGLPEIGEPDGCTHVCSSCSLHDGFVSELGFREDAVTDPISNYGESKLLGEKKVQKLGDKFYVIRLSKLFGKPTKTKNSKKSFFEIMLNQKDKKEVKVVDEETSCFTYAPDLAEKTKEIIEEGKPFGIYHVINEGPCTWYEATLELYKQAKVKTKVIPVSGDEFPRSAQRPYISTLINTKLEPLRSYKEALEDFLKEV